MTADKDLDFVKAWQPFVCGLYPHCVAEAFAFIVPWFGFVILQGSVVIPERGPLHTLIKLVVCEKDIHSPDGVAEIC